jgi:hypothetical protein
MKVPDSLQGQLELSERLIAVSQKLVTKAEKKVAEAEKLAQREPRQLSA